MLTIMKVEIFSINTNAEDVQALNNSFDNIVNKLQQNDLDVIFKTEVDAEADKIKEALKESMEDSESPDMIIIANALTTEGTTSFRKLLTKSVSFLESSQKAAHNKHEQVVYRRKIKIHTMEELGNGYKGYCFKYFNTRVVVLPAASLTDLHMLQLIWQGTKNALKILEKAEVEFPHGFAIMKTAVPKKNFLKLFLPQSEDSGREKIRKTVIVLACLAFIVAVWLLTNSLLVDPWKNRVIISEISKIFHDAPEGISDSSTNTKRRNWDAVKDINPEIIGWIKMENTVIDYPVLENKNDTSASQYYLKRNYKGEPSEYGSIFVDYRCKESVKSKNVILHGHHMNDGSMFGNLLNYGSLRADLDFYRKVPLIAFDTPEEDSMWKIFSVFKTNTLNEHGTFFNYMQGSFNSDAEFMNFVYNVKIRSLFDIPVSVNEDDQLLTLSTCSYEFTDFRTVVVARKVRKGENQNVDVNKVKVNEQAVWPQVYYNSQGGTRPTVTTFKTAMKDGQINWYDGKGNLEGNETLSGSLSTTQNGKTVYTVEWVNYDHLINGYASVIKTEQVTEGEAAIPPDETPTKPDDEYYTYKFVGWGLDYSHVVTNMTIAPLFEAHLK